MDKSESLLTDSTITLTLDDGSVVSFPVSNEGKRDKMVLDSIKGSIPKNAQAPAKPR